MRPASGADLLMMHHALPENADCIARNLHAVPSVIGQRAEEAGVGRMLLSHLMSRSLATLDDNLRIIREAFGGSIEVAQDLACYEL